MWPAAIRRAKALGLQLMSKTLTRCTDTAHTLDASPDLRQIFGRALLFVEKELRQLLTLDLRLSTQARRCGDHTVALHILPASVMIDNERSGLTRVICSSHDSDAAEGMDPPS